LMVLFFCVCCCFSNTSSFVVISLCIIVLLCTLVFLYAPNCSSSHLLLLFVFDAPQVHVPPLLFFCVVASCVALDCNSLDYPHPSLLQVTLPSCKLGIDNLEWNKWNKVKFSPIIFSFHFICLFCLFLMFFCWSIYLFYVFFIYLFCCLFFVYLFLFVVCCVGLLQIILKKTLYFKQNFVSLFVNVLYHP
jgi:hypothetical protein